MGDDIEQGMIDYQWVKQTAKAQGVPVTDLIALAPQNDPFYTGTPNDWALGEWFAGLWQQLGEGSAHLRRVHYYLVSLGSVALPNGKPYANTVECWDVLNLASKAARYLRLVDPAAFNDRRTPEVHLCAARPAREPGIEVYAGLYRSHVQFPTFPDLPQYTVSGYEGQQRYHVEVWCEKSTMNDVLLPLCEQYRANLQTGMGEMSITATLALVQRLEQAGKPARIFYVSDFDPAGQSMPVSVSRKLEYFVRTFGLDLDIRLFPVVLTVEQVRHYQLPRTPIKETERRREGFEGRYGEGAVELDALEALYPGELAVVIGQYMQCYYDSLLEEQVEEARQALEGHLHEVWQGVLGQYAREIEALHADHERLRQEFEGRMSGYGERVQTLWKTIKRELVAALSHASADPLTLYAVPQAQWGQEVDWGLYESARDYCEQMGAYKLFQGRE